MTAVTLTCWLVGWLLVAEEPELSSEHHAAFERAVALMKGGQFADANVAWEQFLARSPEHLAARNNLAVCLIKLRRFPEAEEHLLRVLRLAPANAGSRQNLGVAEQGTGETAEALAETGRAYDLMTQRHAPSHQQAAALFNRAWLLDEQLHWGQAADVYRQAIQVHPGYARAWIGLGVALAKQGKRDEARDAFATAERCRGNSQELISLIRDNRRRLDEVIQPAASSRSSATDGGANTGSTMVPPPAAGEPTTSGTPASTAPENSFVRNGLLGVTGFKQSHPVASVISFLVVQALLVVGVAATMKENYGKPFLDSEQQMCVLASVFVGAAVFFVSWGWVPWGWWMAATIASGFLGGMVTSEK